MKEDMKAEAIVLQRAQYNLSNTKYDFTEENKDVINAQSIVLYHNTPDELMEF